MTEGGFLDRWSRRKRAAQAESAAEAEAPPAAEPLPEVAPEAGAEVAPGPQTEEEWRAILPPIDQITAETDIRVFLQAGVPAALRNAALRRAWAADPLIGAYEDPARDYFWDWNAPGGVPGGGGTLDPGRVAKMLRDIVGPEEKPQGDSPEDAAETPPETHAEEAHDVVAEVPAASVSPVDPPVDPPFAPAPPETVAASLAPQGPDKALRRDALPLRRRHGGAVPG